MPAAVAPLLDVVAQHEAKLADQLKRATQSVALNLAEAGGHTRGNRRLRLESALGSVYEVRTAIRLAIAWRYVTADTAQRALGLADEVAAMTYSILYKR